MKSTVPRVPIQFLGNHLFKKHEVEVQSAGAHRLAETMFSFDFVFWKNVGEGVFKLISINGVISCIRVDFIKECKELT